MTKVMSCGCVNDQQDKLHGPGKRVFNKTSKKDPIQYRCTVCETIKATGGSAPSKKKK